MASSTDSVYSNYTSGGAPANTSGVNPSGFKAQPIQSNNPMANFVQSIQNLMAGQGSAATTSGAATTSAGVGAMAPALDYLTKLTKGDQADVSQAMQPEANRIKDSFTAVRNMISGQPRGGGKAGQLAESGFKEATAVGDAASTARSGAATQLGNLSSQLAGIGTTEQGLGITAENNASEGALTERNQDMGEGSFASQFGSIANGIGALI